MVGLYTSRGLMDPSGLSISSLICFVRTGPCKMGPGKIYKRCEMTHCRCAVRPIHP